MSFTLPVSSTRINPFLFLSRHRPNPRGPSFSLRFVVAMKELGLQINCHSYILKDFFVPPEITKLEKFALSANLIPEFVPPDAKRREDKRGNSILCFPPFSGIVSHRQQGCFIGGGSTKSIPTGLTHYYDVN